MRVLIAAGSLLLCLGEIALAAPNGLANPEFDSDIAPWEGKPEAFWVATDADDCDGSGAAELTMPSAIFVAGDCFAVVEGDVLFGSARVKPGTSKATARLGFAFYVQENCTEKSILAEAIPAEVGPGWTAITHQTTAPAGVASMLFLVAAESGSVQSLFVDRAYAGLDEPVFADTFEAGSPCRWIAVP